MLHHEDLDERNIALSSVEAFCFLFKSAWDVAPLGRPLMSPDHKFHINIVETILFKRGVPHRWLFTSERTNEVLKKKKERLQITNAMLIKAIKSKFKEYCVFPDKKAQLRPKIANVWHVEPSGEINCHLVDEIELGTILECPDSSIKRSIVAVQAYMAGWPYKANGIFEHSYVVDDKHMHHHETYEQGHFPEKSQIAQMNTPAGPSASAKGKKIRIIETQHHMISNQVKTLVQGIERMCQCKVSRLVVQVAFDTMWKPFVLSCRDVHLKETHIAFSEIRSNVLFVDGHPPDIPKISLFFPNGTINMSSGSAESVGYGSYQFNTLDWALRSGNPPVAPSQKQDHASLEAKRVQKVHQLADVQKNAFLRHILGDDFPLATPDSGPPEDPSDGEEPPRESSKVGQGSRLLVEGPGAYTEAHMHSSLYVPPPKKLIREMEVRAGSAGQGALRSSQRGGSAPQNFAEPAEPEVHPDKIDPIALHVLSSEGIDILKKTLVHPVDHKLFTQSTLMKPLTDTTARGKDRYGNLVADPPQKKRFEISTDTSAQNLLVFSEADRKRDRDIVLSQKLRLDDKTRRPISAPHVSRERPFALGDNRAAANPNPNPGDGSRSRKVINKQRNMHIAYDHNYPHENFHDKCCGDYCHFLEKMSDCIDASFLESFKYLADVNYKGSYKSILLAREEAHFVGSHIGDDLDELQLDQLQSSHDVDQVFAFFSRKQIARVSELVREELRHAVIMGLEKKTGASHDEASDAFNNVYRRCVYAGALASVHPSRFYYSVPLCNTCYKLYMFMDHQREKVVLHNSNLDYSGHRISAAGGRQRPRSSGAIRQGSDRRGAHRNHSYGDEEESEEERIEEVPVFRTFEGKTGYRNFGTMIARHATPGFGASAIDEINRQAHEEIISGIVAKNRRKKTSRKSTVVAASVASNARGGRMSLVQGRAPKLVERLKRSTQVANPHPNPLHKDSSADARPAKARASSASNRVAVGIEKTNGGTISSWVTLQASGSVQPPLSRAKPQSAVSVATKAKLSACPSRPTSAAQPPSSEFDYESLPFERNAPMLPYIIAGNSDDSGPQDNYYDNLSVEGLGSFTGSGNVSPFMHSEDQMISPIGFSSHSLQAAPRPMSSELPPTPSHSSLELAGNKMIAGSGIAGIEKRKFNTRAGSRSIPRLLDDC